MNDDARSRRDGRRRWCAALALTAALVDVTVCPRCTTAIVSWGDFKAASPQGQVRSTNTGHDEAEESPFLCAGTADGRLLLTERVVTVSLGGEEVAYPWPVVQTRRGINDSLGGRAVAVLWQAGTVSARDRRPIAGSRDVGAAAVSSPVVDVPPSPSAPRATASSMPRRAAAGRCAAAPPPARSPAAGLSPSRTVRTSGLPGRSSSPTPASITHRELGCDAQTATRRLRRLATQPPC